MSPGEGDELTRFPAPARLTPFASLRLRLALAPVPAFGSNPHRSPNPAVEAAYLQSILQEWRMYRRAMPARPVLRQLHLSGGVSCFHSAPLRRLLEIILQEVELPLGPDFSFDAHACPSASPSST